MKTNIWRYEKAIFSALLVISAGTVLFHSWILAGGMVLAGVILTVLSVVIAANYRGYADQSARTERVRWFFGVSATERSVRWWRIAAAQYGAAGVIGIATGAILLHTLE